MKHTIWEESICVYTAKQIVSSVNIYLRFLVAIPLYLVLMSPPAFAQMGYIVIYSDASAVEGDDGNGATGYAIGIGVTEDSYNSYGHTYWVQTTISSSVGSNTVTSYASGSYARAEAALYFFDETPPSQSIDIYSNHYYNCPYVPSTDINAGTTTQQIIVEGWQMVYYYYTGGIPPDQLGNVVCYFYVCPNSFPNVCNRTNFTTTRNIYTIGNCPGGIKVFWVKLKVGPLRWCVRSNPSDTQGCP